MLCSVIVHACTAHCSVSDEKDSDVQRHSRSNLRKVSTARAHNAKNAPRPAPGYGNSMIGAIVRAIRQAVELSQNARSGQQEYAEDGPHLLCAP